MQNKYERYRKKLTDEEEKKTVIKTESTLLLAKSIKMYVRRNGTFLKTKKTSKISRKIGGRWAIVMIAVLFNVKTGVIKE